MALLVALLLLGSVVSGCGQKGPLYLAEEEETEETEK
jgi:predicted small lipoprotein YifL